MNEHMAVNREWWNERVPIHAKSKFYDLDGFRAGKTNLLGIEQEEVGDVRGQRLLHLQCHFGLSTLSFARLGASVVGVDFSAPAVALARSLADEEGLPARFVESDVYDALDAVTERDFDVVFASYGVLGWLPDVPGWMRVAAEFLRPGGRFHLIEIHPFTATFDDEDPDASEPRVRYPYFHDPEPDHEICEATYADRDAETTHDDTRFWAHDLGEILGSAIEAGMVIEAYRELPTTCFQEFPYLVERRPGEWGWPEGMTELPLQFALRARKPQ